MEYLEAPDAATAARASTSDAAFGDGCDGHRIFAGVKRIAVLRGGGVGDLIMAMPAVNSLVEAYPGADITLLGMPSHAAILQNRNTNISSVEILPVAEGIRAANPGAPGPVRGWHSFLQDMRRRRFDLAVQLHGGGAQSNPLVAALGAAHTVGSRAEGAEPLERTLYHQYFQHEVLRGLEVAALAGARGTSSHLSWQSTVAERQQALALLPALSRERPLVAVHPGARDPRRRWPAAKFAAVAATLAREGCQIVVVGDLQDAALVADVEDRARAFCRTQAAVRRLASAAGTMDLGTLCGMLSLCRLLVANDSGPRHVAEALAVPTASIFWAPNVLNAGPLYRSRHRVQIAWETACPICGMAAAGQAVPECGHSCSFVAGVPVEAVLADAVALLTGTVGGR